MDEGANTKKTAYGRWNKVICNNGNVYRVLRFDPTLDYFSHRSRVAETKGHAGIIIDWSAWLELSDFSDKVSASLQLVIRRARAWEFPLLAVSHPDPATRLSAILAVVSLGIGVLPIIFAAIPRQTQCLANHGQESYDYSRRPHFVTAPFQLPFRITSDSDHRDH